MANFILKLHVDGNGVSVDPRFGFVVENGAISYTVEEGDQVTLPNYNMVRKAGSILVGWTETSGTPSEMDRVYTKYFEPADDHEDLYPVFMALGVGSVKTATITTAQRTSTTMTPYDRLGTDEKIGADAARAQFSAEISDRVDVYVGSNIEQIVLDNMSTAIEEAFSEVREEVLGSITELGSRLDIVEDNARTMENSMNEIGSRVDNVENGLSIATSDISNMSDRIDSHDIRIGSVESDLVISSENTADLYNRLFIATSEISSQNDAIGSIADGLTVVSSQTVEMGSRLSAEIGEQVSRINGLEGEIQSVSTQVSELISDTSEMDTRISSIDNDLLEMNNTIGSLGNRVVAVESEYARVGSKVDATISSVNQLAEGQNDLIGSISSIESKVDTISTQWVKEIVDESKTESQLTRSCTFVLSTITTECSVVIPTNFRYVTKLRDYKISTDYVNAFGSFGTIAWYDNGKLMEDASPVNGGSVLMGNVTAMGTVDFYALPVVLEEGSGLLLPEGDGLTSATNYGYTTITNTAVGDDSIFDSRTTYNAETKADFGDVIRVEAFPNEGCEFLGWYKVDSEGNIIVETPELNGNIVKENQEYEAEAVDPDEGVLSKEPVFDFVADEDDAMYAALFGGIPENDVRNPRPFQPTEKPIGYIFKVDDISITPSENALNDFIDMWNNGVIDSNQDSWIGIGECYEFKGQYDGVVILMPDGFEVSEGYVGKIQIDLNNCSFSFAEADGSAQNLRDLLTELFETPEGVTIYNITTQFAPGIESGENVIFNS